MKIYLCFHLQRKKVFLNLKYRNSTFQKGITKGNKEWCEEKMQADIIRNESL